MLEAFGVTRSLDIPVYRLSVLQALSWNFLGGGCMLTALLRLSAACFQVAPTKLSGTQTHLLSLNGAKCNLGKAGQWFLP